MWDYVFRYPRSLRYFRISVYDHRRILGHRDYMLPQFMVLPWIIEPRFVLDNWQPHTLKVCRELDSLALLNTLLT